jgi:hypothetical protein
MVVAAVVTAAPSTLLARVDLEEDRPVALASVPLEIGHLAVQAATYHFWSQRCGIGDPEIWKRAILAVDQRIRYCASRHSEWHARIQPALEREERNAPVRGAAVGLLEMAFWSYRERYEQTYPKVEDACTVLRSSAVFSDLLAPGSVSEEESAAAWKAELKKEKSPSHHCEWGVCPRIAKAFRDLADKDRSWITAPCAELVPQ